MWRMRGVLHGRHAWVGKVANGRLHWTKEGKERLGDATASQRGVDSGDAPINSRKDIEFGISHPSVGPGGAPWRLDSGEDHEQAWNPDAHVYIGSPWGGSAIGLPGETVSKRVVGMLLGSSLGLPVPCEPVDPVVEVGKQVYKRKYPPKPQE